MNDSFVSNEWISKPYVFKNNEIECFKLGFNDKLKQKKFLQLFVFIYF